ncbi:hypothetical protein Brsp06_04806 [Brucella sp. NBRC 13694]
MIGIFGNQDMGDGRFRRQPRLDQACRCRSLDDAIGAGTARIFGRPPSCKNVFDDF